MKPRKLLFKVHLYLGLAAGLVLVISGLSGSLLVFAPEIDHWLSRDELVVRPAGEPASPQAVLALAERYCPDAEVRYIFPPRTPEMAYELQTVEDDKRVYIDPYRLAVTGVRRPEHTFVGVVRELHTHLLAGAAGEAVLGVSGGVLVLLGLSGFVLWWPGRRALGQALTVRWHGNAKRRTFDMHRAGGFWTLPFLLLSAITGLALIYPQPFVAAAGALWGMGGADAPSPVILAPPKADRLPLDVLLEEADRTLPNARTTRITLPASPQAPLVIRKKGPEELHPNGMSFLYLDPYNAEVKLVKDVRNATAGTRLLNLRYPLHIGHFGGTPVRIVYLLIGLSPALLFITGLLMWRNRRIARRRTRTRSAKPSM